MLTLLYLCMHFNCSCIFRLKGSHLLRSHVQTASSICSLDAQTLLSRVLCVYVRLWFMLYEQIDSCLINIYRCERLAGITCANLLPLSHVREVSPLVLLL